MNYVEIVSCGVDRWNLIWGDPILSGTIFMVSYGVVAVLILRVAQRANGGERWGGERWGRERWLWRLCGLFFVFQVINTPLDLHAMPGAIGHCLAKSQGWYEERGAFKLAALAGIAGFAGLVLLVMLVVFYRSIAGNLLLVSGVGLVFAFTVIKGVGYKEAEAVYHVPVGPFRVADFIEFSGILIAMTAALRWKEAVAPS